MLIAKRLWIDYAPEMGAIPTAVARGADHVCARLDNQWVIKCWLNNSWGQLGLGDTVIRSSPPSTPIDLGP